MVPPRSRGGMAHLVADYQFMAFCQRWICVVIEVAFDRWLSTRVLTCAQVALSGSCCGSYMHPRDFITLESTFIRPSSPLTINVPKLYDCTDIKTLTGS